MRKSGPTSFGYARRDGKLVAHAEEAPIRRRIFELFAEHKRKKIVADILYAENVTTRNGALFTGQTIGRLLKEELVVGIPGEVEALVSQELFEQCQLILNTQSNEGGAKRKVVHLFSGYAFCVCGCKMYVQSNTDKYICDSCRKKIPADDLEAIYVTQIPDQNFSKKKWKEIRYRWNDFSFATKREIIECLTDRIEIDDNKVTCCFVVIS